MKWMLIDLEELAGNIASKVNGARLTPVIEKEIVHYEIIRSLGRNDLLRDITFQGGTSLRLCYGSLRYSEDLDFVAGDKFDSLPLDDFSKTLRSDLLKSYDTEVSVREPKVVNDFDGVGMRRWTVSVNTNIARPDLPKQRIKLEIASVPAHTSTIRRVAVNYPELDGMYDNLTIRCQIACRTVVSQVALKGKRPLPRIDCCEASDSRERQRPPWTLYRKTRRCRTSRSARTGRWT